MPKIADFFEVSIDFLFARSLADIGEAQSRLVRKLLDAPEEERFRQLFEYCWSMECALFGQEPDMSIAEYEREIGESEQHHSSIQTDSGFTCMGIGNQLQYFLMVPEMRDTEKALFDGVDYTAFFKDFSDADVFNACVFLHKRSSGSAFTPNLLVKNLNMEVDKAVSVIAVLEKYQMMRRTQIEMDDTVLTAYQFTPTAWFVAFLIFAKEMIRKPNSFCYYSQNRRKTYLK